MVSIQEAYFLVRVGTWCELDLEKYTRARITEAENTWGRESYNDLLAEVRLAYHQGYQQACHQGDPT